MEPVSQVMYFFSNYVPLLWLNQEEYSKLKLWNCQNKHTLCKKLKSVCRTTALPDIPVKQLTKTVLFRSRSKKYLESDPFFQWLPSFVHSLLFFQKGFQNVSGPLPWKSYSAFYLPSLCFGQSLDHELLTILCIPFHTGTLETSLSPCSNENVVATYFLNLT